ncbi:pyridoxal phosphate-dependent aminotransferase family protein [Puniceicoccaceae bacterium K14]|nr:pyridoxal phosphate-dependent aminotransferase family protein [Puniceicoccaceae bacterium K14]
MIRSLFKNKTRTPIHERIQSDSFTKLRNKYDLYYHIVESQKGSRVTVEGKELLMLASNEYLGLSDHPKVIEAGQKALKKWGSGTMGARSANGGRAFHRELEERLANYLGKEACHVSAAGYLSCMASVAGFTQRGDTILVDKNMHSSVWDGIRLSMADVERFSHNSPDHLRSLLDQLPMSSPKVISIEGVYSMEGHICKLPEFVEIAKQYNCFLVMDDAHGLGVLGNAGRGTADHFNLTSDVDIIAGSLSKALASTGGYIAGDAASIEYLRTHSKQTIFSAAISPSQAACALAALDIIESDPSYIQRLWSNTERYKNLLESLKLDIWESETPAVPIVLGTKEKAYYFWKSLWEKGIFTVISTAPGVPPGKDLVRTAISARHNDKDFELIEAAFSYAASKL